MTTHTHIGHRANVGYTSGIAGWHSEAKVGKRHALNGGPDTFVALCGEKVWADTHDQFGFRRENGPSNVISVAVPTARPVSCRRCLRVLAHGA